MRSLRNKIPDLEAIIDSDEFDLICFVETFLTSPDLNAMFLFDSHSYSIFRFDELTGKGAEVAIFAKSSLRPRMSLECLVIYLVSMLLSNVTQNNHFYYLVFTDLPHVIILVILKYVIIIYLLETGANVLFKSCTYIIYLLLHITISINLLC